MSKRVVVGIWELGKARIAYECLEANHATLGHCGHLFDRTGYEPAPQRKIGDARRFKRGAFRVDGLRRDRARCRIQRHVETERAASGGQRATAAVGTFPPSAAGLVEMHVRIDHAWKDVKTARIDLVRGTLQVLADLRDASC